MAEQQPKTQKTLFQWALPSQPGMALASESRKAERRAQRAAEIGLPWPPPAAGRSVGRPTIQKRWEERIYEELLADNFSAIAHLEDSRAPSWWKPALPLSMPLADVGAAHHALLAAWAEEAPAEPAAAPAAAAASETEAAEPPSKKPKAGKADRKAKWFVPREAQVWFLTWCAHMKTTRNDSERQCWAIACALCPELFSPADENSFRRWHPVAEALPPANSGRDSTGARGGCVDSGSPWGTSQS